MYRVRVYVSHGRPAVWLPTRTTSLRLCSSTSSSSAAPHTDIQSTSETTPVSSSQQPSIQPMRSLYPLQRDKSGAAMWASRTHGSHVALREASQRQTVDHEGSRTVLQAEHSTTVTTTSSITHLSSSNVQPQSMTNTSDTQLTTQEEEEEVNEVTLFHDEVERQVAEANHERNQFIPTPPSPALLIPPFRRLKRHTPMQKIAEDVELSIPQFTRRDVFIALPPAERHPWVPEAVFGPHIVHGDGYGRRTGPIIGTGEVGFEDEPDCVNSPTYLPPASARYLHSAHTLTTTTTTTITTSENEILYKPGCVLPSDFRGLQPRSVVLHKLPQDNGKVLQTLQLQYSFTLTGRGVFATKAIAPGDILMIVQSTAQCLGVMTKLERLEKMCIEVLRNAYVAASTSASASVDSSAAKDFLHNWIFTGQPSSLLESWPAAATQRVVRGIGGESVLYALELHPLHIARLAAIIDLNSFLVESTFAARKGMAYFPEAGFLNHSCAPNATYDIMPEHMFAESLYYADEAAALRNEEVEGMERIHEKKEEEGLRVQSAQAVRTSRKSVITQFIDNNNNNSNSVALSTQTSQSNDRLTRNAAYLADLARSKVDLSGRGAPTYLFCCRATQPIAAGQEILISYVPPDWSFDNRQYVLHDRYHFWCKCAKCAPTLDRKAGWVSRFTVGVVVFVVLLQLLMMHARATTERYINKPVEEEEEEESERRGEYYDGRVLYNEGDKDIAR